MVDHERFLMAGLMGLPVMHSRSPILHNHWLKEHGLKGVYVPLAVEKAGLEAALRALAPLGFRGCNITLPHKETGMAVMDMLDPMAKRIGAINCVTVGADGSLRGSNNDGYGYIESILEKFPDWRADAGPIVVLGAGGGARAVVASLAERGAKEIRLLNRSPERAMKLATEYGTPVAAHAWENRADALREAAMLVNTTSLGMAGQGALDMPLDLLPKTALVSDIIYIPKETALLEAARLRGNRTVNGLGMLLNQARPAFKAWFGILPTVTPELRAMIEATL
jgi:shikimate dehydrogenase